MGQQGDNNAGLDPLRVLASELEELRLRAGAPSLRDIAKKTSGTVSHTTVSQVFKAKSPPNRDYLRAIVRALGGDVRRFDDLWLESRRRRVDAGPGPSSSAEAEIMQPDPIAERIEKKYQVFVSSTSLDLEIERRTVVNALLESAYIPVGMELFNATSEAAWPTIETIIKACDYYIVILGGRYGSLRENEDISFTESEYKFALSEGKPILAFIRKNLQLAPDEDADAFERTVRFRKLLEKRHTCKYWTTEGVLASQVIIGLNAEVRRNPQTGWVRGDFVDLALASRLARPSQALGIHQISVSGRAGDVMDEHVAGCKSLSVISTSAPRIVDLQMKNMINAVAKGCRVRFLVPEVGSQFIKDVDEVEERSPRDTISNEVMTLTDRLREVLKGATARAKRIGSQLGTAEIGYFSTHLRSTIILCDDDWAWLTVTLPPVRASQTASFELVSQGSSPLIEDCREHFETTWEVVSSRDKVIEVKVDDTVDS